MILYAETSAVLTWLLGEPRAEAVRALLSAADRVLASQLTLVECERALTRSRGELSPEGHAAARVALAEASTRWSLMEIDAPIRARAGQPFPVEPVRTLDAIHLATALELAQVVGPVHILSLDSRVVANARALGIRTCP